MGANGMAKHILVDREGAISLVTMNRPERRNALSLEHMQELTQAFRDIGRGGESAVAVLRANGPAFCAGHDLSEMMNREPVFYRELFDACIWLLSTIQSLPQPVMAQEHGIPTAPGDQWPAACD